MSPKMRDTYMRLLVCHGLTSNLVLGTDCLKVRPKLGNGNSNVWHMINNICFHVYAQKSLFIGH